jgi:lipoyl(octanoyl) transferase
MAIDAALLDWASRGQDRAAFRTYDWDPPVISLGRAEPFPEGWDLSAIRASGLDVVRRPTGGDAVLHDGELTFALVASLPGPWSHRPRAFANLVAEALAGAVASFGVRAERVVEAEAATAPPSRPGVDPCFARAAGGEVRSGAYKIAGIASRFTRGAALCHASVPLSARHRDIARFRGDRLGERERLAAHARSISEILGRPVAAQALGDALAREVATRLGCALEAVPLTTCIPADIAAARDHAVEIA